MRFKADIGEMNTAAPQAVQAGGAQSRAADGTGKRDFVSR
jgi:hypothetical protein